MALNLAKRPFVDTRPVNALTGALVLVVIVLSVMSWRTLAAYFTGSRGVQSSISALRAEIARDERRTKDREAAIARFDIEEIGMAAEDANEIARRRSFSWTRFLTRVEEVLPHSVRVTTVSVAKSAEREEKAENEGAFPVALGLISRDPMGLPKTIRALYASPWFDRPVPQSDQGQARGAPEGHRLQLTVLYRDEPRPVDVERAKAAREENARAAHAAARPAATAVKPERAGGRP